MIVGQVGMVCGRKAKIVAIHTHSIRVLYLEPSHRSRMPDKPFAPFESNVPKSYWYCPCEETNE